MFTSLQVIDIRHCFPPMPLGLSPVPSAMGEEDHFGIFVEVLITIVF